MINKYLDLIILIEIDKLDRKKGPIYALRIRLQTLLETL
jgi:hypothetical protein